MERGSFEGRSKEREIGRKGFNLFCVPVLSCVTVPGPRTQKKDEEATPYLNQQVRRK